MKHMSQSRKSYNFNEEEPEPQKSQIKSKKRAFDFNNWSEDEDEENLFPKLKNQSFAKTNDSLNLQSMQTPKRPLKLNFTEIENVPKYTIQEQKAQQPQRRLPQTDQTSLASYIHPEQLKYIQKLFSNILNDRESDSFQELIVEKCVGNDRKVKQEALLFLSLDNFLNQKYSYIINDSCTKFIIQAFPWRSDKIEMLKKWVAYWLKGRTEFGKLAAEKASNQWMMLAEGKINELAERFLAEQNYHEATLASNIQDRAFLQSYEIHTSLALQKEYTLLNSKDVKLTPNTAWPVDFAISLTYFDLNELPTYIHQILIKYQSSSQMFSPALEPALLRLALAYSLRPIDTRIIDRLISQKKRLNYLRQVLYLYTLIAHRETYSKLFSKIIENLVVLIHTPTLFVELLLFAKVQRNEIKHFLDLYLQKNEVFIKDKDLNREKLYEAIIEKINESSQEYVQLHVLDEWMTCEKYLRRLKEGKFQQGLSYYIDNFEKIRASALHKSTDILESTIENVVRFELACSYKDSQRKEYYRLLQELQEKLQRRSDIAIVSGCIAFIQLKFKIFWLHEEKKLEQLYELFLFLKKSPSKNANFLTNLRKTMESMLQSFEGKLYLTETVQKYETSTRIDFAERIKGSLSQRTAASEQDVKEIQLFKLLEMTSWNEKITNLIVIRLLFS